MNYPLRELPCREDLSICSTLELSLLKRNVNVFIEHIMVIHDFVIFFGMSEARRVHGYVDFDARVGCLKVEE